MSNGDLSQITSEIPDLIGVISRKRQTKVPGNAPLDEFGEYFDYNRFYNEGTPAADADSRSRSDASSIPGLTSGPSEEDGAPSPRSTEDAFHFKEAVEKVKQHDDRFTLPAREIRPNGPESYPWHMELDNTLASGGPDIQGYGGSSPLSPASSNGTAPSAYHSSSSADSPLSRGKRHRPLDNPEKVAQMRKIGACFRCKTRKVNCDQQSPCSRCKADAAKYCNDDGELAEHMCFRRQSAGSDLVFQVIWRTVPPIVASQKGNPEGWSVYFSPRPTTEQPLVITVARDESSYLNGSQRWQRWQNNQAQAAPQYVLDPHHIPEDTELIRWASYQMVGGESLDLQSALDVLVSNYAQNEHSFLPHHALVRKVHHMRCMYKIWRHEKFFCQRYPGSSLEELPSQLSQDLKRILVFRMKPLESDILTQFGKILDTSLKQHERLPLWACMMQFMLMYRDIYALNRSEDICGDPQQIKSVTMSTFSNLVVMCEISFGKKKPEAMADDANVNPAMNIVKRQLNECFRSVEMRRDEFYRTIQDCPTHSSMLDRLFCVLLIGPQRGAARPGARASKRAKR
ncbi:hypothetical protein GGS26DRAFT_593761 [Hypomontagnella submonticulosa]|nr:hypothetical protein GGS26DRAFT_593761 [Hypomontagnella submonticulosa]